MVILYSESYITLNRKDQLEKDKKTIFAKDIVIKNRIFIQQHIEELYELFVLYADNHTEGYYQHSKVCRHGYQVSHYL
jgi:hypothetical protein